MKQKQFPLTTVVTCLWTTYKQRRASLVLSCCLELSHPDPSPPPPAPCPRHSHNEGPGIPQKAGRVLGVAVKDLSAEHQKEAPRYAVCVGTERFVDATRRFDSQTRFFQRQTEKRETASAYSEKRNYHNLETLCEYLCVCGREAKKDEWFPLMPSFQ